MPFRRARSAHSTRSKASSDERDLTFASPPAPIGAAPPFMARTPSTSSSIFNPFKSLFRQGSSASKRSGLSSRSVSRASTYVETAERASFEALEYQPVAADAIRARERVLGKSPSSLSLFLRTSLCQHEPDDVFRNLDQKECTVDEYWQNVELQRTAGEAPAEQEKRVRWNARKDADVRNEKARSGGARLGQDRSWRAAISYDEQVDRDELTRLGTVMEVVTIEQLMSEDEMRRQRLKIKTHCESRLRLYSSSTIRS